jgi:hypothetical protein
MHARAALAGCPSGKAAQVVQPEPPSLEACKTPERHDLMVVDWKPELRGDLEIAMKEGIALVLRLPLSQARRGVLARGLVRLYRDDRREKKIELSSSDEVAANLPVGGPPISAARSAARARCSPSP